MKQLIFSILVIASLFSCRKNDPVTPPPDPEPPKYGQVTLNVQAYDSLGQKNNSLRDKVKVTVVEANKTITTDTSGRVVFDDVPYGNVTPVLLKYGFDGPPFSTYLDKAALTVDVPFAQYSTYRLKDLALQATSKSKIYLSFNLDKPIATGTCQVAVLSSLSQGLNTTNFISADVITVGSQTSTQLNISMLPNFMDHVAKLDSNTTVWVGAVPVSYGIFNTNFGSGKVILGENIYYPNNVYFKKDWKN
jgi:hypothetical protein